MTLRIFFFSLFITIASQNSFSQVSKKEAQKFYVSLYIPSNYCSASSYGKYLVNYSNEDYMEAFEKAFMDKLNYKNVVLVREYDSTIIDQRKHFLIIVNGLKLNESVFNQTVYEYNYPENFSYYSCSASADFRISILPEGVLIKETGVQASKDENVNNNRSFFDIIFGLNKNGKVYHVKELSNDIFIRLSRRCGRKTANKATRIINRILKQN